MGGRGHRVEVSGDDEGYSTFIRETPEKDTTTDDDTDGDGNDKSA
jgi:hypothetical protein